jgi:GMP synthase (glutamine-hydrolysing)
MAGHQLCLIIDFGSQVTQLIARRLRELNVYSEIHPFNALDGDRLRALAPRAVILSGGPASVPEPGSPRPPAEVFQLGVPVLGICYGQQAMVDMLGGRVEGGHAAEFGHAWLEPAGRHGDDPIFSGLFEAGREAVWMSHGDRVTAMPDGFEVFGTSPGAPFAMIGDARRHFYA